MERPKPLSPVEAYEAIQRILQYYDGISLSGHVRGRMRDRQFTVDDIQRVLVRGTVSPPKWNEQYQNWVYQVSGHDCDNVPLVLVVAIEPTLNRITIVTGKDD